MANDTPQAPPHVLPLQATMSATVETRATFIARHRPARGVRPITTVGVAPSVGSTEDAYFAPVFSGWIAATAIREQPARFQRALVEYWFELNYTPENDPAALGVRFGAEMAALSDSRGSVLTDDAGNALTDDFGRALTTGPEGGQGDDLGFFLGFPGLGTVPAAVIEEDPLTALQSEFGGQVPAEVLATVADGFRRQSPTWFFVSLPPALAFLDKAEPVTVAVQTAATAALATVLLALLSSPPQIPNISGANYAPGAELLDTIPQLKLSVEAIERELKSLHPSSQVIGQEAGRVQAAAQKIGASLKEAVIKRAADAIVISASIMLWTWWDRIHYYASELSHRLPDLVTQTPSP